MSQYSKIACRLDHCLGVSPGRSRRDRAKQIVSGQSHGLNPGTAPGGPSNMRSGEANTHWGAGTEAIKPQ
jgi:hypothetical protein